MPVPSKETVARWAAETPRAFRFCPKLPREVSHASQLAPQADAASAFVERMRGLGSRLGPIFMQLPPGYGAASARRPRRLLAAWPANAQLTVEVRHPAFFQPAGADALNELLERHGVGRALMDVRALKRGELPGADVNLDVARDRKPDVPLQPVLTAPFSLVRYIGHPDLALNDDLLDGLGRGALRPGSPRASTYSSAAIAPTTPSPPISAICYAPASPRAASPTAPLRCSQEMGYWSSRVCFEPLW